METKKLDAKVLNLSNPKDKALIVKTMLSAGDCTTWVKGEEKFKDGNRAVQLCIIKQPTLVSNGLKLNKRTHIVSFWVADNDGNYKVNEVTPYEAKQLQLISKIKYYKNSKHINVLTVAVETESVLNTLTAEVTNGNDRVRINESLLSNDGALITFNVKPTRTELNSLLEVATTDELKADLITACNICGFNLDILKDEYASVEDLQPML